MVMRMAVIVGVLVVVVVGMLMVVGVLMDMGMLMSKGNVYALLLRPVNSDRNMGTGDPAADRGLQRHMHPGKAQGIHLLHEGLPVGDQLQQRRHQHIASRAHVAFQIQSFHRFPSI